MESLFTIHDFTPRILAQILAALLCGGLIGIERERAGKAAGFRTCILICVGAALYMILSDLVASGTGLGGAGGDRGRIAAQVVSGIGFLGGGVIIQTRGVVQGMTSAATIWVVAAIGLAIGAGYLVIAVLFSVVVLISLVVLWHIEVLVQGRCKQAACEIEFRNDDGRTRARIADILETGNRRFEDVTLVEEGPWHRVTFEYCKVHPEHRRFVSEFWKLDGVRSVRTGLPLPTSPASRSPEPPLPDRGRRSSPV